MPTSEPARGSACPRPAHRACSDSVPVIHRAATDPPKRLLTLRTMFSAFVPFREKFFVLGSLIGSVCGVARFTGPPPFSGHSSFRPPSLSRGSLKLFHLVVPQIPS